MADWQGLYDALAHGDDEHRAWLRGMVQGWASAKEGHPVRITKVKAGGANLGGDPESCPDCGASWDGLECDECDNIRSRAKEVDGGRD